MQLGLHKHIRLMGGQLSAQIMEYVSLVEEAKIVANGALNYWVDVKAPPKVRFLHLTGLKTHLMLLISF